MRIRLGVITGAVAALSLAIAAAATLEVGTNNAVDIGASENSVNTTTTASGDASEVAPVVVTTDATGEIQATNVLAPDARPTTELVATADGVVESTEDVDVSLPAVEPVEIETTEEADVEVTVAGALAAADMDGVTTTGENLAAGVDAQSTGSTELTLPAVPSVAIPSLPLPLLDLPMDGSEAEGTAASGSIEVDGAISLSLVGASVQATGGIGLGLQ
jgi:hypothetical protein